MLIPDILTESKTVNSHIFKKIKAGKCRSSVSLNRNLKPPHSILAFKLSWFGIPASKFNLLCLLFLLTYFTAQRLETKEGSLSLKVITSMQVLFHNCKHTWDLHWTLSWTLVWVLKLKSLLTLVFGTLLFSPNTISWQLLWTSLPTPNP